MGCKESKASDLHDPALNQPPPVPQNPLQNLIDSRQQKKARKKSKNIKTVFPDIQNQNTLPQQIRIDSPIPSFDDNEEEKTSHEPHQDLKKEKQKLIETNSFPKKQITEIENENQQICQNKNNYNFVQTNPQVIHQNSLQPSQKPQNYESISNQHSQTNKEHEPIKPQQITQIIDIQPPQNSKQPEIPISIESTIQISKTHLSSISTKKINEEQQQQKEPEQLIIEIPNNQQVILNHQDNINSSQSSSTEYLPPSNRPPIEIDQNQALIKNLSHSDNLEHNQTSEISLGESSEMTDNCSIIIASNRSIDQFKRTSIEEQLKESYKKKISPKNEGSNDLESEYIIELTQNYVKQLVKSCLNKLTSSLNEIQNEDSQDLEEEDIENLTLCSNEDEDDKDENNINSNNKHDEQKKSFKSQMNNNNSHPNDNDIQIIPPKRMSNFYQESIQKALYPENNPSNLSCKSEEETTQNRAKMSIIFERKDSVSLNIF